MTTFEKIKQPTDSSKKECFNKLQSYFRALENDKLDEYHDQREKQRENRKKYKNKKLEGII